MFSKSLYLGLFNGFMKFIYTRNKSKGMEVLRYGLEELPENCFFNGKVVDKERFISFIKGFKKRNRLSGCSLYLNVNDSSIITRPIQLPILESKDIEAHLKLEAEQYLPINLDSYYVDFSIHGAIEEKGAAYSKLLVSAGPKDNIDSIVSCFDKSGFKPKVMDVYPNNVCRLLKLSGTSDAALLDIGLGGVNITICENKMFYMHSFIGTGIASMLETLCLSMSLGAEEFNKIYSYSHFDYIKINDDTASMDEKLLELLYPMFEQTAKYMDYYNSRHFGKAVEKIYVVGDFSLIKGLKGFLSSRFNTEVSIGMEKLPVINYESGKGFYIDQHKYYNLIGMMLRGKAYA